MKSIVLVVILTALILLPVVAMAQVLTLNSPETLSVPTATKLNLRSINIEVANQRVEVIYRFVGSDGVDIPVAGSSGLLDRKWTCVNRTAELAADCIAVGEPYSGCTGLGTGTGLDAGSTCFTDTFSFAIRTQDVGTPIGKGLRTLIWSKMRPNVLTGANNAPLP